MRPRRLARMRRASAVGCGCSGCKRRGTCSSMPPNDRVERPHDAACRMQSQPTAGWQPGCGPRCSTVRSNALLDSHCASISRSSLTLPMTHCDVRELRPSRTRLELASRHRRTNARQRDCAPSVSLERRRVTTGLRNRCRARTASADACARMRSTMLGMTRRQLQLRLPCDEGRSMRSMTSNDRVERPDTLPLRADRRATMVHGPLQRVVRWHCPSRRSAARGLSSRCSCASRRRVTGTRRRDVANTGAFRQRIPKGTLSVGMRMPSTDAADSFDATARRHRPDWQCHGLLQLADASARPKRPQLRPRRCAAMLRRIH